MKYAEKKGDFIILRSEGYSYDSISDRLKISKPTLIKWGKMFATEISESSREFLETTLEFYKATKQRRIERLAKELTTAWEAYEEKDYKELSKRELLLIVMRLERLLSEESGKLEKTINEMEETDIISAYELQSDEDDEDEYVEEEEYIVEDIGLPKKRKKKKKSA